MDDKQFINDLWDVLRGNTEHITLEQFRKKYDGLFVEVDGEDNHIRMMDDHNEWQLGIQKVWCDQTMSVSEKDNEKLKSVCKLIESANEDLAAFDTAIHIEDNKKGGYFLYYKTDDEPHVCEENISLDKLYERIESLRDTLMK